MSEANKRVFTLEEEVSGLTVIADALKKKLDQKRTQLAAQLRKSGHRSTGTALGEIRRAADKIVVTDEEAWVGYATDKLGAKPVKQYRINNTQAAIQVLLEVAPGLVDSHSAPEPEELKKLQSLLEIRGEDVVGPDQEPVAFAEVKHGSITVAHSARKKAAVEAAQAMIDDAIAPLGIQAIEG